MAHDGSYDPFEDDFPPVTGGPRRRAAHAGQGTDDDLRRQAEEVFVPQDAPNPVQIERDLLRLADELEQASIEFADIARNAAQAEHDFNRKYHTEMATMPATVRPAEVRKSRAMVAAMNEHEAMLITKASVVSARAGMDAIKNRIDVYRTLSANYRVQS